MPDRVTGTPRPMLIRAGTFRILQREWPEKAAKVAEGIKAGRYALVESSAAEA